MRLWTVQPIEVLEIIKKQGYFVCTPNKSENYKDLKDAYDWLIIQMNQRGILQPKGVSLPIWAWHTYNGNHKQLDLRYSGLGVKGQKCVCIELEIEDNQVLLSDYNNWHFVLNDSWYDNSRNEEDWNKLHDWYDKLPIKERERLKLESWQKVFDIRKCKNDWMINGYYVQATFWILTKDMIKNIRYFIAR